MSLKIIVRVSLAVNVKISVASRSQLHSYPVLSYLRLSQSLDFLELQVHMTPIMYQHKYTTPIPREVEP